MSRFRVAPLHSRDGIEAHGVVATEDGALVYAYEVDGRGSALSDTDDPNVPSLLAAPLLGYAPLDADIFATTKQRLLSSETNSYFYAGASALCRGKDCCAFMICQPHRLCRCAACSSVPSGFDRSKVEPQARMAPCCLAVKRCGPAASFSVKSVLQGEHQAR